MNGNVQEWVWDQKTAYTEGIQKDPCFPQDTHQKDKINRTLRGGAWLSNRDESTISSRSYANYHTLKNFSIGFRLLRVVPTPEKEEE